MFPVRDKIGRVEMRVCTRSNRMLTLQGAPDSPVCGTDLMTHEVGAVSKMIIERIQSRNDIRECSESSQFTGEGQERGSLPNLSALKTRLLVG